MSEHDPNPSTAELEIREITSAADAGELRVSLEWRGWGTSGQAEVVLCAPVSPSERELITWYTTKFRAWRAAARQRASSAERTLLQLGRKLGNALVDPDYRFIAFCEQVEAHAARGLDVRIISGGGHCEAVPWELLVLPDSNYVLSAACRSFVRALPEAAPAVARPAHSELRYLRVSPLPESGPSALRRLGLSLSWRQLEWQGALEYELLSPRDGGCAALEAERRPASILHWDGPLEADAAALMAQLQRLDVELLILQPTAADAERSAELARMALRAGVGDVLAVFEPADGVWPSAWLEHLLTRLGQGLDVSQAVVETRKDLQRTLLEARSRDASALYAAHSCSALQHYSLAHRPLWAAGVERVPLTSLGAYRTLQDSLLGFASPLPTELEVGTGEVRALACALERRQLVLLTAERGAGKSQRLHQLGLFVLARAAVERAYRWSFRDEAYSFEDVLQMVGHARGLPDPEHTTLERLHEAPHGRELFVFDDLDVLLAQPETRETAARLVRLAGQLARHGAWCVVTASDQAGLDAMFAQAEIDAVAWPLWAAEPVEQVELVQSVASGALACGTALWQLCDELGGNALLLRKVAARATPENIERLVDEARQHYGRSAGALGPELPLRPFLQLRWSQLAAHEQQFLTLLPEIPDLLLELPMISLDRPSPMLARDRLWRGLGMPPDTSCAQLLTALDEAGFLTAVGGGRTLDPVAAGFVREQQPPSEELSNQLACFVCDGLARLAARIRSQPEPSIARQLLASRRSLSRQIERALGLGEWSLATLALVRLHEQLVTSHPQFDAELGAWATRVLERADERLTNREDIGAASAWLSLALRALALPEARSTPALVAGIAGWSYEIERELPLPVFRLAVRFLQQAHAQAGDHPAYRHVTARACERLENEANYAALLPQLQALATVEHQLGNVGEGARIEARLLHEVPFASLEHGQQLRERTIEDLARARLQRRDLGGVEELIALLKDDPLSQTLRAELAFQREQWAEACERYCALWNTGMGGRRGIDLNLAGSRLTGLQQRLGTDEYDRIYARAAGETPTPTAMGFGGGSL